MMLGEHFNKVFICLIVIGFTFAFCINVSSDITTGLVAYYPFSGNAYDESGNEHHGTEYGNITYVDGVVGKAAKFDGIDDYIETSHSEDLNPDELTISVWVNTISLPEVPGEQKHNMIINKEEQYELAIFGEIRGDATTNEVAFAFNPNWSWYGADYFISLNTFFHVALVFDNSYKARVYIDGSETKEVSYSSGLQDTNNCLRIAARGCSDAYAYPRAFFNGIIDEIRIYNRALSESEIQELYNEGTTSTTTIPGDTTTTIESTTTTTSTPGSSTTTTIESNTTTIPPTNITEELLGVWGGSGNDVFAVGLNPLSTSDAVIFHYDGNTWSNMNSGISYVVLRDVWGSSGTNVFAVSLRASFLLHYDGNSWSKMDIDSSLPGDSFLYGVWGSSGSDVFAVGGRQSTDSVGIILHYNGSTWSSMSSGTRKNLTDVWGGSGNNVFAVGVSGTVLHYDGSNWSSMESGTTYNLWGVWGSSGSDVFAVGEGGIIIHYSGGTWSEIESGTSKWLNGIWGSSGSDVFAVGYSGTILHYDGSSWSEMSSGTTEALYDIWGSSGSDVFAVGDTILQYDGNSWSEMSIESGGCIATYLLEDKAPQLNALRYLRDEVLSKTPEGQEIIRLYYEWSPKIVKAMNEDEEFKEQVKEMIDGMLPLFREE